MQHPTKERLLSLQSRKNPFDDAHSQYQPPFGSDSFECRLLPRRRPFRCCWLELEDHGRQDRIAKKRLED
uniref:Uncharacterized protein n=1 Tax=Lepeophtheirus salmonis TaxID=72036 RepID=A0A0K2USG5_LEPSM